MKKYMLILFMVIFVCILTYGAYAQFKDVPPDASYAEALQRITEYGIITGNGNGIFRPNDLLTREQYAKIIITAAGKESTAGTLKGISIFSDVEENRWSTGYINAAINNEYITGLDDGKFYPEKNITFAEVCTSMVKALGYRESDLKGMWPYNYINKAGELGLIEGIDLMPQDGILRWKAVLMIDRLLMTNIKTTGSVDERTFANEAGLYEEYIMLGNSYTYDRLAHNQIMTDKGIFYIKDTTVELEIGNEYGLKVKEDTITKVCCKFRMLDKIAILKSVDTKITYLSSCNNSTMVLPEKTVYYYNGAEISYENLHTFLDVNTSIVFAYNKKRTGYEYAVILDPVYSKAEVATDFKLSQMKLGKIEFKNQKIIRNGELINKSEIQEKDVIYEVSDLWLMNKYIMVLDEKAEGKITGIIPNYLSPKTLQIDGKNYSFSEDMKFEKISAESSEFRIDDNVTALLGYDGRVVDIYKPEYIGEEMEIIVTDNSKTSEKLAKNQVMTDKGVFYVKEGINTVLGTKYKAIVDGDSIVKINEKMNELLNITVDNAVDTKITYTDFAKRDMVLPQKTDYYHNGVKVNSYDTLKNILEVNTSIIFGYNEEKTGYEYAVILDPVYSKPEVAINFKLSQMQLGEIEFKNHKIVRNGELINKSEIQDRDVIYEVSDIWLRNEYIMVIDEKAEGKITGIIPNYLSPKTLQIDGKNYSFSEDMKFGKISTESSEFRIDDNVTALLGYDGRVVDIYKSEYIGEEIEIIVTDISKNSEKLTENQVMTDKGVFYVKEGINTVLGTKYKAIVDGDSIVKINEKMNELLNITVDNVVDTRITYTDVVERDTVLPQKTDYYYNGVKVNSYDSLKNIIEVNTSIIFAYNKEKTGYEYAVILDPVYSKPVLAIDMNSSSRKIGSINLVDVKIVKNGEIIGTSDIEENDVVYEVTDFFKTSKYILVVNESVEGVITGIIPNKLSPNTIQIDDKNYTLSPDMKYYKIQNTTNAFKIDDDVTALMGYDGEVVDLMYTAEDETSDFAFVVNFEKTISTDMDDYGTELFYVKLALTNGIEVKYKTDKDPSQLKGSLVKYTKQDLDLDPEVEDIMVSLERAPFIRKWKEYSIDKYERKIDDSYVTDNITIINKIYSVGAEDARYDLLNWDEMPHGIVEEGKVQCINKIGDFKDINLVLLNDLFDQKYKYGVITRVIPGRLYCQVDMLIDGKKYNYYSKTLVAGEIGSVVRVKFINNNITEIMETVIPEKQSTDIQAVDDKRIMIDDVIYPFKEDVSIYMKDNIEQVSLKGVNDINSVHEYGKISVYMDEPLESGGKVEVIVLYE